MSNILDSVNTPDDLKPLGNEELVALAAEIRERTIKIVSDTGGHLAANLGVVELTLAMLKIFDPPHDRIVWDTSHQTYAYKLLTGRKDRMDSLRQYGGLSGFLSRAESDYDAFGGGHAGTALSAALGMAAARDRRRGREHVIAVIGDAAAGCGISFEALNNVMGTCRRLIVILNDNEMSIAANVGSLSRYFGGLLTNPRYNRWKRSVESVARRMRMGFFRRMYYRVEEAVKSIFLRSVIFEEFGLRYIGPIDGHNIYALVDALTVAKNADRPILLHVCTKKGKGYGFAEDQPEKWHGTPNFDVASGERVSADSSPTYSKVFGAVIEKLAETDDRIVAITAAMPAGTGLSGFAKRFPNRFYDVGISEEHGTVFAAGLATEGLVPMFAVYSTFMQRAVDCMIHDVCLQNLHVVICLDRAGIVGDDGPTHHGVFDIPLLRPIPGLVIMQPGSEHELANMLYTATRHERPFVIRYPRGIGTGAAVPETFEEIEIGKALELSKPADVSIWALGDMVPVAERAAELLGGQNIGAGVVNTRFVRPLDRELLARHAAGVSLIATLENGILKGGFGEEVEGAARELGFGGRVLRFGWPDRFIPHGSSATLMEEYGLTAEAIAGEIARHCTHVPEHERTP